jgi:hypothetical protein
MSGCPFLCGNPKFQFPKPKPNLGFGAWDLVFILARARHSSLPLGESFHNSPDPSYLKKGSKINDDSLWDFAIGVTSFPFYCIVILRSPDSLRPTRNDRQISSNTIQLLKFRSILNSKQTKIPPFYGLFVTLNLYIYFVNR